MSVVLYHNPRCSKSRATLKLLQERGIEPTIIEYLKTPPEAQEIVGLIARLGQSPMSLVRKGEAEFADAGLAADETDPTVVAQAIARFPKLLQRPVVVSGGRARIGRPPETVTEIL